MVRRARRFGFNGAACIHPGQVPIVNAEYIPGDGGSGLCAQGDRDGRGSESRRPRLLRDRGQDDRYPVVVRAETLMRRYEAIKAREAKTHPRRRARKHLTAKPPRPPRIAGTSIGPGWLACEDTCHPQKTTALPACLRTITSIRPQSESFRLIHGCINLRSAQGVPTQKCAHTMRINYTYETQCLIPHAGARRSPT